VKPRRRLRFQNRSIVASRSSLKRLQFKKQQRSIGVDERAQRQGPLVPYVSGGFGLIVLDRLGIVIRASTLMPNMAKYVEANPNQGEVRSTLASVLPSTHAHQGNKVATTTTLTPDNLARAI